MSIRAFRMYLTPISPVHIGSGESLDPTRYVIESGWLHHFDSGAVAAVLDQKDRKKLLEIAAAKPGNEMLKDVRQFFHDRRERLMPFSLGSISVPGSVGATYRSNISGAANVEADGSVVLNRLEVDRTATDALGALPYVPGSSVKGAIRTALLDDQNHGRSTTEKKGLHPFQSAVFGYSRNGRTVLEADPLRLLQVSDLHCDPSLSASTEVLLAVNRKKAAVTDAQGNLRKSQAENLYQTLECISPWQFRGFVGQVNLQDGSGAPEQTWREKMPDRHLWPRLDHLARSCNRFYIERFRAELAVLENRQFVNPEWAQTVKRLLEDLEREAGSGVTACLVRIGRHSGAESVTLNGVRRIKIMKGKDSQGKRQSSDEAAAKTLWLAADGKAQARDLLPFGWAVAEFVPLSFDVPKAHALDAACQSRGKELTRRREELAKIREKFSAARKDGEAERERKREEAARAAAEAEQRRAAEEQAKRTEAARRSALSPQMLQVEDFRSLAERTCQDLRGGKERAHQGFTTAADKLASTALSVVDWTAEERKALAAVIEEWLPKIVNPFDLKDARKRAKLARLNGDAP